MILSYMNNYNLLIIDNRIQQIDSILESITCNYIILDYYQDTWDTLIGKISNLNLKQLYSIGLLRHAYFLSTYKLIDNQVVPSIVENINKFDLRLTTWIEIKNFIISLKQRYNLQVFNFISCRLDIYPDYQYIFNQLQFQLNIQIGASIDDIGNQQYGGSWILETNNLNVLDIYFNQNILNYPFVFYQPNLIIKANNIANIYNKIIFNNPTVSYSGFINNDNLSTLSGKLQFNGTYPNAINVGSYTIIPYGLTSTKYNVIFTSGSLVINKTKLFISIGNNLKIYDGTNNFPSYTVYYSGFVNDDTEVVLSGNLTLSGTYQNAINVGSYTVILSGLSSDNYDIIYQACIYTILPKDLLVIANDITKIYDGQSVTNSVTYEGFVGSDTTSSLSGLLQYSGNALNVGVYTITPFGLTSTNYNIIFINGTLTINNNELLIKANDYNKFYDSLVFNNPTVTVSDPTIDLSNNLYFSGSYIGESNVGTWIITPSGYLSNNFNVKYYDGYEKIDKNEIYIIAQPINKFYDGIPYTDIIVNTISGLSYTISGLINMGSSYGAYQVGTYTIIPTNLFYNNYNVLFKTSTLTIYQSPLYIIFNSYSKIYDATSIVYNITYSLSGIFNNESLSIVSYNANFRNINAGSWFIDISNVTLSGLTKDNYYIKPINPIVGYILPKYLTANFYGGDKINDGTTNVYNLTYSLSGVISNEYITISSYIANFRSQFNGYNIIDISNVILTGLTVDNYLLNDILPIMALIYQNFLQINFYGGNKIYDGTLIPGQLSYTISGLVDNDILTISSYLALFRNQNIGTNLIDISNIVMSGQNLYKYVPPKYIIIDSIITSRYLDIHFNGGIKTYDATRNVNDNLSYQINNLVPNEYITISNYYAQFKTINAGNNQIDISNIILFGITSNNYLINHVLSISSYIYQKILTPNFIGGDKIYDGTIIPSTIICTVSGLISNDSINPINEFIAFYQSPNVGYQKIDISNLIIFNPNYYIESTNSFYSNIYLRDIFINFYGGNKVYDTTINTGSMTYTIINLIDTISISSFLSQFRSKNVGYNTIDISNIVINGPTDNYNIISNLTISSYIDYALLSAFFTNGSKTYDGTLIPGLINYTLSGILKNDEVLINSYDATFQIPTVGFNQIDISNIILSGSDSLNYQINYIYPFNANIYNRNVYISFSDGTKIYDGLYTTGPINYTLSGVVKNDDLIILFTSLFRSNQVGNGLIDISNVTLSGLTAFNYTIKPYTPFESYIYQKDVTSQFYGGSKIYDQTLNVGSDLSYNLFGIVNNDNVRLSYTSLFRNNNVGSWLIDISNISINSPNYNILPTQSIYGNIYQKELNVKFYGGQKTYNANRIPGPITYSLSGIIGLDPVSISSYLALFQTTNTGYNFIDISNIIITNNNYYISNVMPLLSYIYLAQLLAIFSGGQKIYDSLYTTGPITYQLYGVSSPDIITIDISNLIVNFQNNNVGTWLIDVSNANIIGTNITNYNLLPIQSFYSHIFLRNLFISFNNGSKIYDSNRYINTLIFDLSNNIPIDNISISSYIAMFQNQNVGSSLIDIVDIKLNNAFNYNLLPIQSVSGVIYPKGLNVYFSGGNKIYDRTLATGPLTNTISGIVNNENIFVNNFVSQYRDYNNGSQIIDISFATLSGYLPTNYYILPINSITGQISKRPINANFYNGFKIYDKLSFVSNLSNYLTNTINLDDVFIDNYTANFITINAGLNLIDISFVTISGVDAFNYILNPIQSISGFIYPKLLDITFSDGMKTYDGTNIVYDFSYNIIGIIDSDNVYLYSSNQTFRNVIVGNQFIDVSNILLSGLQSTNYIWNQSYSFISQIYLRKLYIIFSGGDKNYDNTIIPGSSLTSTINNAAPNETLNIISYYAFFDSPIVGLRRIDISNLIITGPTITNYILQPINSIYAYIYNRQANVIFSGGNKTYDGTIFANNLSFIITGTLPSDIITITQYTSNFITPNVGLIPIIISDIIYSSNVDISNYNIVVNTISADIYPRIINTKFTEGNKIYDGTLNTGSISGYVMNIIANDDVYVNSFTSQYRNPNVGIQQIDISNILLGGAQSLNYQIINYSNINGTISKAPINAIFTANDKIYDGTNVPYNLSYIMYPLYGTDQVFLNFYNGFYTSINVGLNRIDISNAIIAGSSVSNYKFNNVAPIYQNIFPKPLNIYFNDSSKTYDNTPIITNLNYTISGVLQIDNLYISNYSGNFNNSNAGLRDISLSNIILSGSRSFNYSYSSTALFTSNIYPKQVNITFNTVNKTYDGTPYISNTISGYLLNIYPQDNVYVLSINGQYRNINTSRTVLDISNIILSGLDGNNYFVSLPQSYTAQINKRILQINFSDGDKIYDGTLIPGPLTYLINNIANSEIITINYNATFKNKNAGFQRIDISNVILVGQTINNYSYLPISSIYALISQKGLNIFYTGLDKIYDSTIIAYITNPIISGLIFGENNVYVSSYKSNYYTKFVENNKIITISNAIISGNNSSNYYINTITASSSNITPKPISLIATGIDKIYDQTTYAEIVNLSLSGVYQFDNVTISSYLANYIDPNVQNKKLIQITNIQLKDIDAINYALTTGSTFGNIYKRFVPVYFTGSNKSYDGNTLAVVTNGTISGILYPDIVNISYYKSNYENANIGINKQIIVSDISFNGLSSNNYYTTTSYTNGNITWNTIIKATITSNNILYKDISNYLFVTFENVWQNMVNDTTNYIGVNNNIIISDTGNIYNLIGQNLTFINSIPYQITNLIMIDSFNGLLCGLSGLIVTTTNSFHNYFINFIGSTTINSISKIINNTLFCVGMNGTLYRSNNNGNTWSLINLNITNNLYDIAYIDNLNIIIVGSNGIIIRSYDNGLTWNQTNISIYNLYAISMFDKYNGFIVGTNGTILRINDGINWITSNYQNNNLNHVFILNANDAMIVGDNGIILRTKNRGLLWEEIISGTFVKLNKIYMYDTNIITIVGNNGFILNYYLNPSGTLYLKDNTTILSTVNIISNNPSYKFYFNNYLIKSYLLNLMFVPDQLEYFGIGYTQNIRLNILPIFYYLNNRIETTYDNNQILYSSLPFVDQSGGIFNIIDNLGSLVQQSKVIILTNGQIQITPPLNINQYIFSVYYTLNNMTNQTTFSLIVRPNIYYLINSNSLLYGSTTKSIVPYTKLPNGTFTLDTSSNTLIDSSGIITIGINPVNNYSINIIYTYNQITNITPYYFTVLPFINYSINNYNLEYQSTGNSIQPTINPLNGYFTISGININPFNVSINNQGIITFNNNIFTGLYNLVVWYNVNNIFNNTIYTLRSLPQLIYPEIYRSITYEHTIYDASSIPIYNPIGGLFNIIDLSGQSVNSNLVSIDQTGKIIFGTLQVNYYMYMISYFINNVTKNVNYTLEIKPTVYYQINNLSLYYGQSGNSSQPYVNPINGNFYIVSTNNSLTTLNLVTINFLTGIISFSNKINVGNYYFRITYRLNNIDNYTTYNLIVHPVLNYPINQTIILYGNSATGPNPNYSPTNGLFSLSGLINYSDLINNITINNGILSFNSNIYVNIYNFSIIYTVNSLATSFNYQLIVKPNITYIPSNTTIYYNTFDYSALPIVNPPNGTYDVSLNIDISGKITFFGSNVGSYNYLITYNINNVFNTTTYNLIVNTQFYYPIGNITLLYDRLTIYNTELPFVDQNGGIYQILSNYSFVSIDSLTGYLSISPNINVGSYLINVSYTLNSIVATTTYTVIIQPNLYYTISSIITTYGQINRSISPYYNQPNGIFQIDNNLVNIDQTGKIYFNNNIHVGSYIFNVLYTLNQISNNTNYYYVVKPNLSYLVNQTIINYGESSESIEPNYSESNGLFTITPINLITINSNTGVISFNNLLNVGIYLLTIYYTLNNQVATINYELNVLPTLYYNDQYISIFNDRLVASYSERPIYNQVGGVFTIQDDVGNLVINQFVTINTLSGIITFNTNILVDNYSFIITYTLNNLSVSTYYYLSVLSNLYYLPNTSTILYNTGGTSVIPYYGQANGAFSINDISNNLVPNNFVTIDNNGIITFQSNINVGLYSFRVKYTINASSVTTLYYLNIIPIINYPFSNKNIIYGNSDYSVLPIVNQPNGSFFIYDLSNNGVFLNNININQQIGEIYFSNSTNVGIYLLNVEYRLNNASNYFKYRLNVYPTINYNPNNLTLLYNRNLISNSVIPNVQQSNGEYIMSEFYIDASGIINFPDKIPVGTYTFQITYKLNGLTASTSYYLNIIPNLSYTNTFNILNYHDAFVSEIPYYDQSGGLFSFRDISGYLVSNNIIRYDISNGRYNFIKDPDVNLYNLEIKYTLKGQSNINNIIFYILPIFYYNDNNSIFVYQTDNYSYTPFIEQQYGYFTIDYYDGLYIDTSDGTIYFSNSLLPNYYNLNVTYILNGISKTTVYNATILPVFYYSESSLELSYDFSGNSIIPYTSPSGGIFDISNNINGITIDSNTGIIYFDALLNSDNYILNVSYTYNNVLVTTNYNVSKNILFYYNPSYSIVQYNDISNSLLPIVYPLGGIFNASLDNLNINYSGISINPNTGRLSFGIVNPGDWTIYIQYTLNNSVVSTIYKLSIISNVKYNPPYASIKPGTIFITSPPSVIYSNGQFQSTFILTGFSCNIATGVLTFNNIGIGYYNIPINYTVNGQTITLYYILIVQPIFYYPLPFMYSTYGYSSISPNPFRNPTNGIFTLVNNNGITINSISGYIIVPSNLPVNTYIVKPSYSVGQAVLTLSYTIIVNSDYNYPIGYKNTIYETTSYSEAPFFNPIGGNFSSSNKLFYVNNSTGVIIFKNTIPVGSYNIPIKYTYNNIVNQRSYKLTVYPIYYYSNNIKEIIVRYGGTSLKPHAKQDYGNFNFVSISGTFNLPYIFTTTNSYLDNGIVLNTYNGIINFGRNIKVGAYYLNLSYSLLNLTTSTSYSFIVKPYINYDISSLVLDYNTPTYSSIPIVDQSGGFFSFYNPNDFKQQINKIIINTTTGLITFNRGIDVGIYKIIIRYTINGISNIFNYKLNILSIFYYLNPNFKIIYGDLYYSELPNVTTNGGIFTITDSNNLTTDYFSIDPNTGILRFYYVDVGNYNFVISYTYNNSVTKTTIYLTVMPQAKYDINYTQLLYSKSGYSDKPYVPLKGGLFTFNNLSSLDFLYTKALIDASNGQIYFAEYINVGLYDIYINYFYKDIYNVVKYTLNIIPMFNYEINSVTLTYTHDLFSSVKPYVLPESGLFYSVDQSNNSINSINQHNNGIIINKSNGIIIINKIPINKYSFNINYYLKNEYNTTTYYVNIVPNLNYDISYSLITYGLQYSYSPYPSIDPSGGIFSLLNPINVNLSRKISINNTNGLISWISNIPIDKYTFTVGYKFNNIFNYYNYNLIVQSYFIYNDTENLRSYNVNNLILIGNKSQSSQPIVNPKYGLFSTLVDFSGVSIDASSGIINFDKYFNIGKYSINIYYLVNNVYAKYNYLFEVLPNVTYDISFQTIIYGFGGKSSQPLQPSYSNLGMFYINPYYNIQGIFIDISSGILTYKPIVNVNNYSININYSIQNIIQTVNYKLNVIPNLYYDISNITINYGSSFTSKNPYVNPSNGSFIINVGSINLSGAFTISNFIVDNYNLNIDYKYNNQINSYKINLNVLPIFYYPINYQTNIYSIQSYSTQPVVNPLNGSFNIYSDIISLSGIISLSEIISLSGIIKFNPQQDIGKYNLIVFYNLNNQIVSANYNYVVKPYINYADSGLTIYGKNQSLVPTLLPFGGLIKIKNIKYDISNYTPNIFITIDSSGVLLFDSRLIINDYIINLEYSFNDISNNFNYYLYVSPYISYLDKVIYFGNSSTSETPYVNVLGGIFTITLDQTSIININSLSINKYTGVITFNSDIDVNIYYFYVNYTINYRTYTFKYNLTVKPTVIYPIIKMNHNTIYNQTPTNVKPIGGQYQLLTLSSFVDIDTNGKLTINGLNIGNYNLIIEYIYNLVSTIITTQVLIYPIVTYTSDIILYQQIGSSLQPTVSVNGGYFISYNLPLGLSLNTNNGIVSYNGVNVNNYNILIYYVCDDISGLSYYNLLVQPIFYYLNGATSVYGQNNISTSPTVLPTGGLFSLTKYLPNIFIDQYTGYLSYNSNLTVNNYMVPIVYTLNDVSSTINFNIIIIPKTVNVNFIPSNKLYDGTTSVIMESNKLVGVINDDKVFIKDTYNARFSSPNSGHHMPILINNLSLGGPDSFNYLLDYSDNTYGDVYLFKYDKDLYKVNFGIGGLINKPSISNIFINPLFIISNIDISNHDLIIDPFGSIAWTRNLPIGIYNLNIYAYNATYNDTFNLTLEITTNLYIDQQYIIPPDSLSNYFVLDINKIRYSSISGLAYVIDTSLNGLVCDLSITAYQQNTNNLIHDLIVPNEFLFKLNNADPSANLIGYELNDDGSVNYSVGYNLIYKQSKTWSTGLIYLSNFFVFDLSVLPNYPPILSPKPGTLYGTSAYIYIDALPNSTIFYTLDGTTPTPNSYIYTQPIFITSNITIKAYAISPGRGTSSITTGEYIFNNIPCILSKTLIRTPNGNELIDNLNEGDLIVTEDGRHVPIVKILKYQIENPTNISYPVCINKDYFGQNVPCKNTFISQNHAIKLNDFWIYGRHHMNYFSLHKIKPLYYHILLPNYFTDNLIANNMVIESWSGISLSNANVKYTDKQIIIYKGNKYKAYKRIRINILNYIKKNYKT